MDWLIMALGSLVPAIPVLLVWTVGLVLAALRLSTHRRSSMLLGAGLLGLMVQRVIVWPSVLVGQTWMLQNGGYDIGTVGLAMGAISFVEGLVNAVWWGLVLAAVFVREPGPLPASEPNQT